MKVNEELTLQGHIVLMPGIFHHSDEVELTTEQKIQLDNLHRMKINMSDAIFVINQDGYIGESTYGEIDWAQKNGKQIVFMEKTEEDEQPDIAQEPEEEKKETKTSSKGKKK